MLDFGSNLIIEKLNNLGFEAFVVGGAVRNFLLKLDITDFDITTSATPEQIKSAFADYKLVLSGEKHGTIGVIIKDKLYEITTYRCDGLYTDFRRPDCVKFTSSLNEDILRRDFTINALCYHKELGIIDKVGGLKDLKSRIITTVGDPKKRFNEDALRMLRAVRFASVLGFEIEQNTLSAMKQLKSLIKNIAVERIFEELKKILCGKYVKNALIQCDFLIFEILSELKKSKGFNQKSLAHNKDVFGHTLEVLSTIESDEILRFVALFHDSGKPYSYQEGKDGHRHFYNHWKVSASIAEKSLKKLNAPKDFIKDVTNLCLVHDTDLKDKYEIKKMLNFYGREFFERYLKHKKCDLYAHSDYGINKYQSRYLKLLSDYNEVISNNECYSLKDLNFTGEDAKSLGFSGEKIGALLSELLELVMIDKLANDKDELTNYVIHKYL